MLRTLFVVDTFVAGAFGIVLLFAPGLLFTLYGMQYGASSDFVARLLGAFVLGQAPLLWAMRDHTATPAGIAITRAHGTIDTVSTILCAQACLSGVMNGQGWGVVALFALFGAGRLYYGFFARPAFTPGPAAS